MVRRGRVGRGHGRRALERLIVAVALVAWAGPVRGAGAAEPMPAPLSSVPPPAASAAVTDAPPRALPSATTICRAAAAGRCWTLPGERTCAPGGEPFRVVPDAADEVARALEACRAPSEAPPPDRDP